MAMNVNSDDTFEFLMNGMGLQLCVLNTLNGASKYKFMKEMSTYVNETNFLEAFRCKPHLVASMVYYETGVLLPFVRGPLYPGHVNQQNVEPEATKSNLQRRGSVYINPNYIMPPMRRRSNAMQKNDTYFVHDKLPIGINTCNAGHGYDDDFMHVYPDDDDDDWQFTQRLLNWNR